MAGSETPRSIPWYKRFRDEFSKSLKYIYAMRYVAIKRETLDVFDKETLARFIFESNNLEREGLPFGETKELVILGLEEYPDDMFDASDEQEKGLFKLLKEIKRDAQIDFGVLNHHILNDIEIHRDESNYELIAKYGGKSKEADKVIQYFLATRDANYYAVEYRLSRIALRLKESLLSQSQNPVKIKNRKKRESLQKEIEKIFSDAPNVKVFITEDRIKLLHELMADGFVDKKNAKAGQYRTKPIMTDLDSHYPAPNDVPAAMANFVKKYQEFETQNLNPIALAAWASTQFVLIHPFPDFNGRMSRLLMNMILRTHGVPFWVSLSSSGKERKKYIAALRQAREGNYLWISTLISIQLNQGFHDLNRMLDLAGYDQIETNDSDEFPPDLSDKEILFTAQKNE